ncbi:2-isopropylmalate synthase [Herbaspirillum rubrisubalbicans]|uniref:2-isopropylmalate synthase n=3 Tax=Herbaspirillum TaxID=963 RepID=A0ABX9C2Y5_9BURK|nr:2-isopropylmalate synthase [Herbaspirillum rubrisubalbicans]MCP1573872.1 2-isopropylmalate synthase [Herbaspirillum rubrisubalbicans]NQE48158.1 2-isopropylmalate synthase [Herbaspirillum rubrisubalbicans]QJQ02365.1 2-isopropylmalate synthase [Herbaspirillum rubrisubalbicans Os34]RAM64683.1 2-isopropylmalate synthase [Herbaspirillum rubrisubalbicans]RAN50146.1 2-isopropylmalate synthase [Herbaspirillum rubrisubalbicans]
MMLSNPAAKYRPFPAIDLPDRTWPSKVISTPPIWMSTDLRDGNQALIEPMNAERKLRFFELLLKTGLKEIEVGFPSASQTDFDFVRKLIVENRIPDDVTIIVLTQSRDELIRRTVESLEGAKKAIVHLYNSVAPAFRKIVFNMSREEIKNIAVTGTRLVKELTDARPGTEWRFEYSPESFSTTELDFSKEICDAVCETWGATPERKVILNLPSTVECATPNVYADQIEWMCRNLKHRASTIISVHPHNDRGTAVASAELAVMAGADRVEGCLFGNGERTGNVDLVTLALNLYTQGVNPGLDFSDIDVVRQVVEECNQIPVHPRHPYVGDLVFTAFSGSHQDAIKKGFAKQQPDAIWEVPYLPIDPADLGRSYDAVIRVNSQSGKGGMAYLLEQEYGLALPRRLQIEFSRAIQREADATGKEIAAADIHAIFQREYLERTEPYVYRAHRMSEDSSKAESINIEVDIVRNGQPVTVRGSGNGPIDAFVQALGLDIKLMDFHEHAIGAGADAKAASYIELRLNEAPTGFGVGIDANIVTASFKAVLSAVNRQIAISESANQAGSAQAKAA